MLVRLQQKKREQEEGMRTEGQADEEQRLGWQAVQQEARAGARRAYYCFGQGIGQVDYLWGYLALVATDPLCQVWSVR